PKLVAEEDRLLALPPLLDEREQRGVGLVCLEPAGPVHDPGRPVDAEPALAGPHAEPEDAADVVEVDRVATGEGLLEPAPLDELALADQLVVVERLLPARQPRAEPVVAVGALAGQLLLGRP